MKRRKFLERLGFATAATMVPLSLLGSEEKPKIPLSRQQPSIILRDTYTVTDSDASEIVWIKEGDHNYWYNLNHLEVHQKFYDNLERQIFTI